MCQHPAVLTLGTGDVSRYPDWDVEMLAGCIVSTHGMVLHLGVPQDVPSGSESLLLTEGMKRAWFIISGSHLGHRHAFQLLL